MAVWLPVLCPDWNSDNIIKHGRLHTGKQRGSLSESRMSSLHFCIQHRTARTAAGSQAENCGDGSEWKWH